MLRSVHNSAVELVFPLFRRKRRRGNTVFSSLRGLQPFSIVGRRYSAGSSRRFSPFFSDRFERRGLVYVGSNINTAASAPSSDDLYPVDSWLDTAQTFNGTSDKVVIGNQSELNFTGEITLTAAVKIDSFNGLQDILAHGYTFRPNAEVFLRLNGNLIQAGSYNGQTYCAESTLSESDLGQWITFTGTYDGENWNLYKDGVLIASSASSVGAVTVNADWVIGASAQNNRFFDGEIKDVAIYRSALTASQVAALYNGTLENNIVTTSYAYTPTGAIASITDPEGNTTSYGYDYRGLVISETNAKGYTRYFEYDANGRLTEKTDRNGRVTTYTYDAAGRLTSESWLDSSNNAVNTFTYQYDILGNLLSAFDGVSSCDYTYDTMNRIDSMTIMFDAQMAVFSYTYDTLGRQTESSLRLNGVQDRTINIEYDYLGRALSAELTGNALNDILAEFNYNSVGALTNINRYEWDDTDDLYELIAKSNIQYNARNQITNISHADASNVAIAAHSYSFSPDGNITQYTNSLDGFVNYDYDFLGQLIGADYSNLNIPDESYQYDLNGNRELVTNANGDLVVYSTGTNNELTSDGAYTYAYDAEGNRISKTNATGTERELYVWDYRNRLSSVTKQEYNATTQEWQTVQIVEYAYDYNNVLIRKVLDADGDGISDSKTIFLPENYQTAVQLDDADLSDSTYETVSHRYLWTPGQQDKLLADVTPTESLWTLTDHLGTVRDIIQNTPSGLVVPAHIIYDAYGNVLSCKDPNGTDVSSPVLFGFTGKYFDADTQLQNNVNRWYDATVGRWLSTDPIGFNGNDMNLYCYVGNSSTRYRDSFGLAIEKTRNCHEITKNIFTYKTNGNKNAIDGVIPLYGILSLRYQLAVSGSILVTTKSCEALCGCTWKTGYSEIKASANLDITLKATLGVNFSKKPFVGGFYSLSVGLFAEGNFKREHSFLHVTNPCGNPHEGKYCSELNASLRIGGEALLQYETGRFFSWTIGAQLYGEAPFITKICFTIDKNGNLKLDGIKAPTFKDAHLMLRAYFGYEYVVTLL